MSQNNKKILINLLTLIRILGIPCFIFLDGITAFALLNFLFITDFLDGYLSRKYQVTSQLGAILDLLADKTLTIFLLFVYYMKDELWLIIVILLSFRELYSIGLRVYYYYNKKGLINASFAGKLKTALMFIAFDFLVLNIQGYQLLFIVIIGISYYSLFKYILEGKSRKWMK
ncbi:MAG: CDP-alcohol phosphatidyltransferase family protein [Mycoplasmatales bacterium]